MKICTYCKREKELSEYSDKPIRGKPSLDPRCKECVRFVARLYYSKNKDKILSYQKEYYLNNFDYVTERQKNYYNQRIDKYKEYSKNYRKENREKLSIKSKERYESNKEKYAQWRIDNYDKIQSHRATRRARKKNCGGKFTYKDIELLKSRQKNKCVSCSVDFGNKYHIDHIMPLALGGSNFPKNLQLLCPKCNQTKQDKHPIDFMQEKGFLL